MRIYEISVTGKAIVLYRDETKVLIPVNRIAYIESSKTDDGKTLLVIKSEGKTSVAVSENSNILVEIAKAL